MKTSPKLTSMLKGANAAKLFFIVATFSSSLTFAQTKDPFVTNVMKEAMENSQLEKLAHELLDVVGPRLVGTPQIKQAGDWAVKKYAGWGISARMENLGQWRGWERGITHIDLLSPRVRSLEGTQLAWSPSTKREGIKAEAIVLPDVADSLAFVAWLPKAKGKVVLISMNQISGRPDKNIEEFATPTVFAKVKKEKDEATKAWRDRLAKTGLNAKNLALTLERAGAAAIVINNWSQGFGVDKIFGANTTKIPTLDLSVEDYGLVYRLAESGTKPTLNIKSESKELGLVPTFNTIAEIKGTQKPNEYVMLSAHFDSWDGASGATDNGSGTIMMMETMRLLKKFYPNPKRTILVGHWSSEEQGLNGSRAFVEDHPEIVSNLQALFNQDNGTGRIANISGQGFAKAKDFITRWLAQVPDTIKNQIKTLAFPGSPSAGGSDNASFVAAGAPGFSLGSNSWDYFTYTWHTNRDSYDKLMFDEIKSNVVLAAILVYMACEDPEKMSTEKAPLGNNQRTGQPNVWPTPVKANRKGGVD